MGKAAKSKSRQSRRADSDGVGNLSPVGGLVDNNATTTTPGIVVKLGSIDSKKRLGALVMLNDLLIQNAARSSALGKLTEPETLSALSVRLLDTSIEVVQQTIICLVTISRMGKLYVEKLSLIGLDVTIVRLLSQSLSTIDTIQTDEGSNIQRSIPFLLLELVKVMFTNAPSFARSKRDVIATMILQNSSKLVSHISVAEFVCALLSATTVDSAALCRQLYDGQLHGTVKAALLVPPDHTTTTGKADDGETTAATLCLDTLLSAILLNLLSCSSDSDINEANTSSIMVLLPRLIERVSLRLPSLPTTVASAVVVSSTAMTVDDTTTTARVVRTLDDNKSLVAASKTIAKFYQKILSQSMSGRPTDAALGNIFELYLTKCFSTALSAAKAVVEDGHSVQRLGNNDDASSSASHTVDSLTSLMDACEHVLEDACSCYSALSSIEPPPVASVPFIATPLVVGGFVTQLVEVLTALHDLDDLLKSTLATAGDTAVSMTTESSNIDEDQQGRKGNDDDVKDTSAEEALRSFLRESRDSTSCAMESALESLSGMAQLAENDTLLAAMGADADVQRMALMLCRYSACCYDSVSVSSVMLIGLLAQKDGQIREQQSSSNGRMLIQPRINALLSNAVLRLLESHVAKVTASAGSMTSTSSSSVVGNLLDQLGVIDTALGAFIDLHASDDLDLLQNFLRLNALQRLTDLVAFFDKSVDTARQLQQQQQPRGSKRKGQSKKEERMVTDDGGEDEEDRLEDMLSDFDGTLSNAKSFLEYKTLYVNR